MVYLVNSHTNATSKRWEIGLRFALNSTPGWNLVGGVVSGNELDDVVADSAHEA